MMCGSKVEILEHRMDLRDWTARPCYTGFVFHLEVSMTQEHGEFVVDYDRSSGRSSLWTLRSRLQLKDVVSCS